MSGFVFGDHSGWGAIYSNPGCPDLGAARQIAKIAGIDAQQRTQVGWRQFAIVTERGQHVVMDANLQRLASPLINRDAVRKPGG